MAGNNVVPMNANLPASIAALFEPADLAADLTEGVGSGFAVLSIRGSKWRVKYQGEEIIVLNDDGEPKPSVEVVMLKASKHVSKNYFEGDYEEGSSDSPDCSSSDGIKPDAGVPNPQNATCQGCQWNEWGSRITDNGKKAKKCSDNRIVAVVPADDIGNADHGGAMLLRVSPTCLADLKLFGQQLATRGIPYNAIVTRLGFDVDTSYPKLTFKAVRVLNEEQGAQVAEYFTDPDKLDQINQILGTAVQPAAAPVEETPAVDTNFEEPPAPKKAAPKKAAPKKAAKKAAKTEEPAPEQSKEGQQFDDDISGILDDLDITAG